MSDAAEKEESDEELLEEEPLELESSDADDTERMSALTAVAASELLAISRVLAAFFFL